MVKTKDEIIKIINDYIKNLNNHVKIDRVILFGSYARNEALSSSDVDFLIVSDDFSGMSFFERLEFLQKFWNYNVGADILGYTPGEVEEMSKKISFVSEVVKTGIDIKAV